MRLLSSQEGVFHGICYAVSHLIYKPFEKEIRGRHTEIVRLINQVSGAQIIIIIMGNDAVGM